MAEKKSYLVRLVKAVRYNFQGVVIKNGQTLEVDAKTRNYLVLHTNGQFEDVTAERQSLAVPEDDPVPEPEEQKPQTREERARAQAESSAVRALKDDDNPKLHHLADGRIVEEQEDGSFKVVSGPEPEPEPHVPSVRVIDDGPTDPEPEEQQPQRSVKAGQRRSKARKSRGSDVANQRARKGGVKITQDATV